MTALVAGPQGEVPGYLQPRDTTPLGPKRLRYSHDAMIDLIVAQPDISQNELAGIFGYTPSWVSVIMASDAFRERLSARRAEIVDTELRVSVNERFRAIVLKSQEVLLEKLSAPAASISDATLLKALEVGGKAINAGGLGHQQQVAPAQQPPVDRLNGLADRLVGLLRKTREENPDEIVDVSAKEVPSA